MTFERTVHLPLQRPEVVAHRGASHDIAEHTLAAYEAAIDAGADALECDVRLTADGHLVCVHDRTLRRVANHPGVVSEMELRDLQELDVSSWKNGWAVEPDLTSPQGRVLTLRTLLETVRDSGRRVELNIETKHPTRYGGLVERKLATMLGEFGWDGAGAPVRVMSFQWTALQRMDRLAPGLAKVLLMEKRKYWPFYERIVAPTDWWLGPWVRELREHRKFARKLGATGRPLYVWTVNDEVDMQVCLDLGVQGMATDRPAWARAALDRVAGHGEEVPAQKLRPGA